ncbi:hypothetical protein IAG25_25475 [Caballeronia sp. EK]|uniref:hypothetical protein n=1 Tax=Caballeronia sp. EK TaxID=2767469 RepID=UPI001655DB2A|nr:hypothetical protein [Caballeronia sp. EK]MBC8640186.1 hypothetical protein [Caballeronia sp. EK]
MAYTEMRTVIDPALKALACEALKGKNVSVSDFFRSALVHLVEKGDVPFDIQKARGDGVKYTPRHKEVAEA